MLIYVIKPNFQQTEKFLAFRFFYLTPFDLSGLENEGLLPTKITQEAFNFTARGSNYKSYPFIIVTGCISVCLRICVFKKISLTAKMIVFSFAMRLLIGPEKANNYFKGGVVDILIHKILSFLFVYPLRSCLWLNQ